MIAGKISNTHLFLLFPFSAMRVDIANFVDIAKFPTTLQRDKIPVIGSISLAAFVTIYALVKAGSSRDTIRVDGKKLKQVPVAPNRWPIFGT